MLKPGTQTPPLEVAAVPDGTWKLSERRPDEFTMIVNYRGYHCPICKTYLQALQSKLPEFEKRGVEVIAISGDERARAEKAKTEWGLENLTIGYGQTIESMREWGLLVSKSIKDVEPRMFGEPALFLVRPDGTLYHETVQSTPFTRPPIDQILSAIDYITANDYPPRGTV